MGVPTDVHTFISHIRAFGDHSERPIVFIADSVTSRHVDWPDTCSRFPATYLLTCPRFGVPEAKAASVSKAMGVLVLKNKVGGGGRREARPR